MWLLKRLLGKSDPRQRIRICMECGMPVTEHKEWCAILRGHNERSRRIDAAAESAATTPGDS